MEPVEAAITKIPVMTWYTIYAKVVSIREEFEPIREIDRQKEAAGIGGELLKSKGRSLGWFVVFEGSREAIHMGYEKPDIEAGDEFKITFKKVNHAKPSEPSK